MTHNVGNVERGIRGLVGVLAFLYFLINQPTNPGLYWGTLIVGLALIATAALAWCPAFSIFGIDSTKDDAAVDDTPSGNAPSQG